MTAFDLTLAGPLGPAFTGGLGGPGAGTHAHLDWRESAAMRLGAAPGSAVRATLEGRVTERVDDTATGVRLTLTDPSGRVSAFHTFLTDVPARLQVGARVAQGEPLGAVLCVDGVRPHLHLALGELVAGRTTGIDLYSSYLELSMTQTTIAVTFFQHPDAPPVPVGGPLGPTELREAWAIDVGSLAGVQRALVSLGFDPGLPSGVDGPRSRHAVRRFQADHGLRPDGVLDARTRAALASVLTAAGLVTTVA
ncbi:peptidoglycan-binding protein [Nocardioides dongxiaopingii]|uniref:peptidoglycan-binding protein n=1 Tax=Nocardioides dongxiaopingii TaxID=2576036 RepID=UPI0010C76AB6|nr:peptidoglycan-binding protein [Nocardioides dongxiaopingii]